MDCFENLSHPDILYDEALLCGRPYIFERDEIDKRGDLGEFWDAVKYFANSDLPNSYFLQHLKPPYPELFCRKKYWHGLATVLAYRGIDKIDDVKEDIFVWFQDGNWPGNEVVWPFILKNKEQLKDSFINSVWKAFDIYDIGWFWYSIKTFEKFYELKNEELAEIIDRIFNYAGNLENWSDDKKQFENELSRLFPRVK
ncbi:MAG: hypothetical protein LBE09_06505 [Christensenellaceae bacterium]|jgi:hypothetical protein|nr:hypothetical protein [Christensenellaceae bacterium]